MSAHSLELRWDSAKQDKAWARSAATQVLQYQTSIVCSSPQPPLRENKEEKSLCKLSKKQDDTAKTSSTTPFSSSVLRKDEGQVEVEPKSRP